MLNFPNAFLKKTGSLVSNLVSNVLMNRENCVSVAKSPNEHFTSNLASNVLIVPLDSSAQNHRSSSAVSFVKLSYPYAYPTMTLY